MDYTKILIVEEKTGPAGAAVAHYVRRYAPEGVQVSSMALTAAIIPEKWRSVFSSAGMDVGAWRSVTFQEMISCSFDLVIALGEKVRAACPVFPGVPPVISWSFPELEENAIEETVFHSVLKDIEQVTSVFFKYDYLGVLRGQRRYLDDVLNSMKEGVIAHDLERRILFFSKGAEAITGFKRQDVLGQDCHKVFVPSFCGDQCSFCDKTNFDRMPSAQYQTVFLTSQSHRRQIQVTRVPIRNEQGVVTGVIATLSDETRVAELEKKLGETEDFSGIIGQDYKMLAIFDLIKDLAQSDFSVVITGESGTGKELVAAAIHKESSRRDKLFVPVNCGALPEGTLESELFGHVKGAFTGAIRDKKGRFELADTGTIFLDEIGELSLQMQVRLLRVLQEGTFEPVGSEFMKRVDVRVICATNRNLKEMVGQGSFREDLYYRLAVVPVEVPPLRERRNDIALIARHALDFFCRKLNKEDMRISDDALSMMMNYSWPGNVRQLQNALQFSLIKCRGEVILPEHLPPELSAQPFLSSNVESERLVSKVGRKPKLSNEIVERALVRAGGNKAKAARILGVGRATLYNFLNSHSEASMSEMAL